ncbi:hypothetical protein B0T10DRAFT_476642 [Thelonectria olida]|uniref:Secreted protein n=1 Tax=Thelonectria olida TaxID=1576542 RepID=A0A9P8WE53_9HYPO|nr:hypothetical protein B0T10DRAFT_476642 [Thelonectria olida]
MAWVSHRLPRLLCSAIGHCMRCLALPVQQPPSSSSPCSALTYKCHHASSLQRNETRLFAAFPRHQHLRQALCLSTVVMLPPGTAGIRCCGSQALRTHVASSCRETQKASSHKNDSVFGESEAP